MIVYARGENKYGYEVYFWSKWRPEWNYNALYDDMPMEGWWPWPKKETSVLINERCKEKRSLANVESST
jgi:hypothetical protein